MAGRTKPIVIIGGGFGGLRAALDLDRRLGDDLASPIYLVDPSPFHLFTPELYEVAGGHSARIAAIHFQDILRGTRVRWVQEKVVAVDTVSKAVRTSKRMLPYHDLVLAVGSMTRWFDLGSQSKNLLGLKSLDDAFAIRDAVEAAFRTAATNKENKALTHIVVVGAGPSGVELAASLRTFSILESRYHALPKPAVKVVLAEASSQILGRLDSRVQRLARQYLKQLGVEVKVNTAVKWNERDKVLFGSEDFPAHTVIWTAGVQANSLVGTISGLRLNHRGQVIVDAGLQAIDSPNVWAIGDSADIADAGLAQSAVAHGRHVARSILASRRGQIPPAYQPREWPVIISLANGYAVAKVGGWITTGWIANCLRYAANFRYYLSILPFVGAWQIANPNVMATKRGGIFCYELGRPRSIKEG